MKLVREHINEKFAQDSDPIKDLNIGLRNKVEKWLDEYINSGRTWINEAVHKINKDFSIDVIGDVNLYNIELEKLPDYIKFNKVTSNFWINSNKLTTLKGCPKYVGGTFYCCNNNLTSLEYAPEIVKHEFVCYGNVVKFTKYDVRSVCKVGRDIDIIV